ncbi:MAG: prfA [Burkholderiaceae bacterium]|nr:prfA [Burkholderiaceae bacterium]
MKPSMRDKLSQLVERHSEINHLLQQPDVTNDIDNYRKLTREHAEITPVVEAFSQYIQTEKDIEIAQEMLADAELKEFAQEEIQNNKAQLDTLQTQLRTMLIPRDENDNRNVILEIRAGTGGEESALFAANLLRMYTRYAERQGWRVDIMSESPSDLGGYREVIVELSGNDVYATMKFESGGHRVQRVPETEAQGRIHTSACTVAVMPEADEVGDVIINPADLRIDTFRASGAGGQHINKTDSAVRITHIPTGTVVECQDDRSQHRNKDKAMKVLVTRIRDAQVQAQNASQAATRKSLVGSGDRSERIRTYNFPQGRITDHRVNLTWYKIDAMMLGDLDEMFQALAAEYQAEQLMALGDV